MLRLTTLMFCVFAITTGEFVVAGILPEVARDRGVSVGTAGLLVTAYAAGMIVGGPLLTALTTRFERKALLLALLGVAAVGNVISATAPDFAVLLGARVLTASVTSTFFAHAIVIAVRSAQPGRTATAVARLAFAMNLAILAGAPLGTLIGAHRGWRATFLTIGIACLIGLVLVAVVLDRDAADTRAPATDELRVLRRRPVLLALALTAVGNTGVLMVFSYLAPLLAVAGVAAGHVPAVLFGYGVGATIGNLVGGALYDRFPRVALPAVLGVLAAVMALLWLAGWAPVPAVVAVITVGALGFAVLPGMQAKVMTAAAQAPTLAMAVNASGYQLAAAVAGLLGGFVVDSTAGPRLLALVAAGLTVAGLAVYRVAAMAEPVVSEQNLG